MIPGHPGITPSSAAGTLPSVSATSTPAASGIPGSTESGLPIRLLMDRVLVRLDPADGERLSAAGIVIPATASVAHRLAWATAVAVGPSVRSIVIGDRVLFDPDDRSEVELHGRDYILLRERDVHAVAATRIEENGTGLYL
jgi:chaperonin GroES